MIFTDPIPATRHAQELAGATEVAYAVLMELIDAHNYWEGTYKSLLDALQPFKHEGGVLICDTFNI